MKTSTFHIIIIIHIKINMHGVESMRKGDIHKFYRTRDSWLEEENMGRWT